MRTKTNPLNALALGIAAGTLLFASCTRYQQQGAAVGALGGAALGALAGDDSDDVVRGAALGAGVGAGAAALHEEHRRRSGYYNTGGDRQPTPPPPPAPAKPRKKSDYPLATPHPTSKTRVISPYKPHNVIDVTGFRSGQLARDPSTAPIDPETGQPDLSKAKIFELP